MHWIIEAEDLSANAMIETQRFGTRDFLLYRKIEQYGDRVAEILGESHDSVSLNLSRTKTDAMLESFSDFFTEKRVGERLGISLKSGKSIEDLIWEFRGYLPLPLLLAFTDERAYQVLEH